MSKNSKRPSAKSFWTTILNIALGIGAIAVLFSLLQLGSLLALMLVGAIAIPLALTVLAVCLAIGKDAVERFTDKEYRERKEPYIC